MRTLLALLACTSSAHAADRQSLGEACAAGEPSACRDLAGLAARNWAVSELQPERDLALLFEMLAVFGPLHPDRACEPGGQKTLCTARCASGDIQACDALVAQQAGRARTNTWPCLMDPDCEPAPRPVGPTLEVPQLQPPGSRVVLIDAPADVYTEVNRRGIAPRGIDPDDPAWWLPVLASRPHAAGMGPLQVALPRGEGAHLKYRTTASPWSYASVGPDDVEATLERPADRPDRRVVPVRVVGPGGRPAAGAQVYTIKQMPSRTDDNGVAWLEPLRPGDTLVAVHDDTYTVAQAGTDPEIEITTGEHPMPRCQVVGLLAYGRPDPPEPVACDAAAELIPSPLRDRVRLTEGTGDLHKLEVMNRTSLTPTGPFWSADLRVDDGERVLPPTRAALVFEGAATGPATVWATDPRSGLTYRAEIEVPAGVGHVTPAFARYDPPQRRVQVVGPDGVSRAGVRLTWDDPRFGAREASTGVDGWASIPGTAKAQLRSSDDALSDDVIEGSRGTYVSTQPTPMTSAPALRQRRLGWWRRRDPIKLLGGTWRPLPGPNDDPFDLGQLLSEDYTVHGQAPGVVEIQNGPTMGLIIALADPRHVVVYNTKTHAVHRFTSAK